MLSIIFEYNWIKINDIADFSWDSYISLTDVWWLSWNDISVSTEKVVDTHNVIDFPWFMSGRILTMWGWIIWKDEVKTIAKINELNNAFSVPSFYKSRLDWYHKLSFYRKWALNNEKYFINARVKKLPRIDKTMHIHRKRWFYLELFAEDPFIYSETENTHILDWNYDFTLPHTLPWSLIKKNTEIITQNWNCWATTYFKITWAFKSLEIENKTTGQIFSVVSVNINDWEFIEIFWKEWKVYKNWIYDIAHELTNNISISSEWIFLDWWANEIEMRWSENNWEIPVCTMKYRDTFNNIEL